MQPGKSSEINWQSSPIGHKSLFDQVALPHAKPLTPEEEAHRKALTEGVLSPLIGGPWMDRWEMTNVNEHVKAYRDNTIPEIPRFIRKDKQSSSAATSKL